MTRRTPVVSRPDPKGYFLAEDAGRGLLPWSHVVERMTGARNYWVASTGRDGRPHCLPVWGVWHDERFVFSTSPIAKKARNVRANPWAVVHLENGAEVVVVEGPVLELTDAEALERFRVAYNPKYEWDFTLEQLSNGGVFSVEVARAFAWLGDEGDAFAGTATRWVF